MKGLLFSVFALLLTDALLMVGNGLHSVLIPLGSIYLGFSTIEMSVITSAYFIGFVASGLATPLIIKRVGHIRTLVVCSTLFAFSFLVLSMANHIAVWVGMRFIIGVAMSGCYMIIESWLNERATNQNRGRLLSLYYTINLMMMIVGQQLVLLGSPGEPTLLIITACVILLAIIPVSLTKSLTPAPIADTRPNIAQVWQHSKLSILGIITAGFATASFWGLSALFIKSLDDNTSSLTLFMSSAMLGGVFCQLPLGRLSDKYRRGWVIMGTATMGAIASFLLSAYAYRLDSIWWFVLSFFWGGGVMTLYSLCLAHANDRAEPGQFVVIGSVMILSLGLSSAVGAPLMAIGMSYFGPQSLYYFISLILLVFVAAAEVARRVDDRNKPKERIEPFVSTSETSQMALELDPRAEATGK